MMRRILSAVLIYAVVLAAFTACSTKPEKEVSCEDVISAYEEAGYVVEHIECSGKDYGYSCVVNITVEDYDSTASFKFYETDEEAQVEADKRQWNVILWLYTSALFQPKWLHTKSYRNIEIEYDDSDLYKPFRDLIN